MPVAEGTTAVSNGKTTTVPRVGATKVGTPPPVITLTKINAETFLVPIVGTSPLIVNKFTEKAKRMILDGQQGIKKPRENRDPEAEFNAAFYRLEEEGRYGFPATAFKLATIGGARYYGGQIKMTELRQFMFFHGTFVPSELVQLVEIESSEEPTMREDMVGLPMNKTDLRYRPQFWPWSATLKVTYVKSSITMDSVVSLIEAGGMGVGVGEWRPEKDGTFGTYSVDMDKEIVILP
jgi:hypothetical protein